MKVRIGKLLQRFPGVRMVQMKGFLQEMIRVAVSTASALRGVEFQPRVNGRIYLRIEVDKTRQNIGRFQGEMFPKIVQAKGRASVFENGERIEDSEMSLCSSCDQMSSPSMFERVALHITLRFRQEEYTLVSSQLQAIKDLKPTN
jgi:hypothetical protein